MAKIYKLRQEHGAEVQAAIDKIAALGPDALDAIGIRYNTTEYWDSQLGYIPPRGSIIIYSDHLITTEHDKEVVYPGIKIGSGNAYVQDRAFLGEAETYDLATHVADKIVHTSSAEKAFWNRKLNVDDETEVVDENLIFNRN